MKSIMAISLLRQYPQKLYLIVKLTADNRTISFMINQPPSYLSYTGHGMIERYPRGLSLAYVTGHERRHKVGGQLKALAKGKEVSQDISYRVAISNGKLIASRGLISSVTRARENNSDMLTKGDVSNIESDNKLNPKSTLPDKFEISNRVELVRMNRKRDNLADKLKNLTGSEIRPANDTSDQEIISNKNEIRSLKNQIIRVKEMIQRIRHSMKTQDNISNAPDSQSSSTIYNNKLSVGISEPRKVSNDYIKLRGQHSIITDSSRFMRRDVPGVMLNNGVGSALRAKGDLKDLAGIQPVTFMHVRFRFHPRYQELKKEVIGILEDKLNGLNNAVDTLSQKEESFNIHKPVSARPNIVEFGTSFDSPDGKYKVKVLEIARGGQAVSRETADPFAPLGYSGSFNINGYPISVVSSDSLNDIKIKINYGEDANRNDRLDFAEDINGNGQIDSFHIKGIMTPEGFIDSFFYFEDINSNRVLDQSEDTNNNKLLEGGAGQIHVAASIERNRLFLLNTSSNFIRLYDDNGILKELDFFKDNSRGIQIIKERQLLSNGDNLNRTPQKAAIELNNKIYERDANNINDIITGTMISIKQVSQSSVEVIIQRDYSHSISMVNKFVENYNNVIKFINEDRLTHGLLDISPRIQNIRSNLVKYIADPDKDAGSGPGSIGIKKAASGDSINQASLSNLKHLLNRKPEPPSLPITGDGSLVGRLEKIGIKNKLNDTLTIDSSKLSSSIKMKLENVINILSGEKGISGKIMQETQKALDPDIGALKFQKDVADSYNWNQFLSDFQSYRTNSSVNVQIG